MKNALSLIHIVILIITLGAYPLSVSADDAKDASVILPDFISFSNGNGLVSKTGQESSADYVTYSYSCKTDNVEFVVQEYIRELRKFGIYISQSEKEVYDIKTNDANYGVALQDKNQGRNKFSYEDEFHEWTFSDVSIYITFSTGGSYYGYQYVLISYAKGSYKIADTGAKMKHIRRFSPEDYYFYRNQLKSDAQKKAYDYLLSKLEAMESPISLEELKTRMDYDEFFLVLYSVLIDNPQIFTVDDNKIGDVKYNKDGSVRSFSVYYHYDKKDLPEMKKAYEKAITKAMTVIDPYMTDYQKELALHDWLCRHIRYDYSIGFRSACSYNGIVNGQAVCEGYSESFTELLHRAGIEAATVYGFVKSEKGIFDFGHAWNIVRIDGMWYYVDVTWDDTSPLNYDYFNLTTAQMGVDHKNGIGTFPLCNSKEASYHK